MKEIEVTVEVRRRLSQKIEVPDDLYEAFINGEVDEITMPEVDFADMFERCRNGEGWEETDYAITNNEGETVVPWND